MGWTRRDFAVTFQRMLRQRYVEIGREVQRLRNNLGYSQEELAHRAGVSYKTISRMETPPSDPHETRGSTYRKVAEALGVTVEHLRAPLTRGATISESDLAGAGTLEQGLAEGGQDLRQDEEASDKPKDAQGRRKRASGGGDA